MKHGIRKSIMTLLAGILLLALAAMLPGAAAADTSGDINGDTGAATTFYVYANGSAYIRLHAGKGTAYTSAYDFYGNYQGNQTEEVYGFFRVQVSKTGFTKYYTWAPPASMNTVGIETSAYLTIVLPGQGDYKVVVTPLNREDINGTYWAQNRFQSWAVNATWEVTEAVNCNCRPGNGGGQQIPQSGTVTVNCYNQNGAFIQSYTERLTASRMVYPKTISGYTTTSSAQYVTYYNGVCNPSTLTFYYTQNQIPTAGTVTVYCYDTNGSYIRSYTETIYSSGTLYPRAITGYTVNSAGQYITYNNGAVSPASITFYYKKQAVSATVTVYCYDSAGIYIRSYTETITASKTIYPQDISGYTALSSGQYITYSNGAVSPASVTFYYQKESAAAYVNVSCYDDSENFLRSYTETITASGTIYPQNISGYTAISSGQYITYSKGACSPSSVTFYYQKVSTEPAKVKVYCYDEDGNSIETYTVKITSSKEIKPKEISGYTAISSGQKITYSNGTASPSSVSFYYKKEAVPATVKVTCYDSFGNKIDSYSVTITETKKIKPKTIPGYKTTSSAQKITYKGDGTCSPKKVEFYYTLSSTVTPGTDPNVAYPTMWDTQFKPGTATANNGSNADRFERFPNMYDDKEKTSFWFIYWKSEREDDIPEFTAYFDGATVSSIGIRNGIVTSNSNYKSYGRIRQFIVKVYDNTGDEYETVIDIPDKYTKDYQIFPLGKKCKNVSYIELWQDGIYKGEDSREYVIHITDIQFYK